MEDEDINKLVVNVKCGMDCWGQFINRVGKQVMCRVQDGEFGEKSSVLCVFVWVWVVVDIYVEFFGEVLCVVMVVYDDVLLIGFQ